MPNDCVTANFIGRNRVHGGSSTLCIENKLDMPAGNTFFGLERHGQYLPVCFIIIMSLCVSGRISCVYCNTVYCNIKSVFPPYTLA